MSNAMNTQKRTFTASTAVVANPKMPKIMASTRKRITSPSMGCTPSFRRIRTSNLGRVQLPG
jgi:hypothetical protein